MATNEEKKNGIYKVGADGKGPSGLTVGDQVVTAAGTYTVTGVNADGTYKSQLTNKGQTTSNYTGKYENVPTTTGGTTGSGYKTLNEQVYGGLNDSAVVNTYKDGNGNTIKEFSEEATKASKDLYNQQVQNQVDYINKNPSAVNAFGSDEFMSLYGDVYTTAPNGTQVKIKDLVDVGNGTYTYNASKAEAARAQGYTVTETTYAGKPAYYIKGIKKETPAGTSGADESLLSDTQYAALLYERDLWYADDALYKEALESGNTELAEQYKASRDQHHLNVERLRAGSWLGGYSGGADGSMHIDHSLLGVKGKDYTDSNTSDNTSDNTSGSSSGGSGNIDRESILGNLGSGSGGDNVPNTSEDLLAKWKAQAPDVDTDALVSQWKASIPDVDRAKADQMALLEQWKNTLLEQSNGQIDYNVAKAITELERAMEDAQPQFKEQQESVAKDEMQALDNSALYAEARGDKGGIGQEQYNSIMNTAAQNRLSIQQAQTKLSTDTQRQIADLRAQGEFEKADAMLEISQQYLSQLMALEQWAMDYGLSTAQFQASLDQWAANYKMAMAEFTTGLDQWAAEYDFNVAQWQTGVDQWEKSFAYQQYRDQVGDNKWELQFEHSAAQDAIANTQWQQSFDESKNQWWADFNNANDQWQQQFQYGQTQDALDRLTNSANTLLSAGVANLSAEQLEAIGLTAKQAADVVDALKQSENKSKLASAATTLINAGVGELTAAQLEAAGFTPEQAAALVKIVNEEKQAAADSAQKELELEWAKLNAKGDSATATNALYQLAENNIPPEQATGWLVAEGFEPDEAKLIAKAYESMLGGTGAGTEGDGPQTAKDGTMSDNTVAWAQKVLAANDGDVDYLAWALEQRGFSEEEIKKVLVAMGLMK